MKLYRLLYRLFDYRLFYIGWSSKKIFSLKWGIAVNLSSRWKVISKSMKKSIEIPLLFLPMFLARSTEKLCHDILGKELRTPIKEGSGRTEFFSFIKFWLWPRLILAFLVYITNFVLSTLTLESAFVGIICLAFGFDFWESQLKVLFYLKDTIMYSYAHITKVGLTVMGGAYLTIITYHYID